MQNTVREKLVRWFGSDMVAFTEAKGIQVKVLVKKTLYSEASPELRSLGIRVDEWPVPPAGLFVVSEKTVYIKDLTDMTLAHEYGHAIDCALGDGTYHTFYNDDIRKAFARARAYVTPYAATGLDEFFAESMRAYVGVNNPTCPWPPVSRAVLANRNPEMLSIIEGIFRKVSQKVAA